MPCAAKWRGCRSAYLQLLSDKVLGVADGVNVALPLLAEAKVERVAPSVSHTADSSSQCQTVPLQNYIFEPCSDNLTHPYS